MRTLIFDTETTDLIKNSLMPLKRQPRVIEFYGEVVDEDNAVIETREQLIHPGFEITAETTKITGITREMLAAAPKIDAVMLDFITLIESCEQIVAHNLSYDKDIMDFEAQRLGLVIKWPSWLTCTVENSIHYKGHRLNLTALHEHLTGINFAGAHRAKNDVQALTRCFVEMRKRGDL